MKFPSTITCIRGGAWSIRHESVDVGLVEVTASTRDEAIEKLRQEIRYRLELCPCSGEMYQHIKIEIV